MHRAPSEFGEAGNYIEGACARKGDTGRPPCDISGLSLSWRAAIFELSTGDLQRVRNSVSHKRIRDAVAQQRRRGRRPKYGLLRRFSRMRTYIPSKARITLLRR